MATRKNIKIIGKMWSAEGAVMKPKDKMSLSGFFKIPAVGEVRKSNTVRYPQKKLKFFDNTASSSDDAADRGVEQEQCEITLKFI